MHAASHSTDTQAITKAAETVAGILDILAIQTADESVPLSAVRMRRLSSELQEMIRRNDNPSTLRLRTLEGVKLAKRDVQAQARLALQLNKPLQRKRRSAGFFQRLPFTRQTTDSTIEDVENNEHNDISKLDIGARRLLENSKILLNILAEIRTRLDAAAFLV